MPSVNMTRPAFLNEGFVCPIEGCGERVTSRDIVEAVETIGSEAPMAYTVRCPKCWTTHVVQIQESS